jgi:D-sedoheptulose 7-phosphate isomerase
MPVNHICLYIDNIKDVLDRLPYKEIEEVISVLWEARLAQRQIFIMGNGGSGSTASHFVCDLAKNTQSEGLPSFRVIGLNDNIPLMLAYANDEGYENVFARQLESYVQPQDVVIVLSGSGNSKNVIRAVEVATHCSAKTIAFTGFDGGKLGTMVDINVNVPSDSMPQIEDIHLILEHIISNILRDGDIELQLTKMFREN